MKRPVELDDIFKYNFLSSLKLNKAEDKLGFIVSKTNYDDNSYESNVYLYDLKTDKYIMATGLGKERGFEWENDHSILFVADRDGSAKKAADSGKKLTNLYRLDTNGGEAQKAYTFKKNVVSYKFLEGSKMLLLCKEKLDEVAVTDDPATLKEYNESKNFEVIDEVPFWFNGKGFINKIRNRLYLHDLNDDTYELLSEEYADVLKYEVRGNDVFYICDQFENVNMRRTLLKKLNLETKQITTLTNEEITLDDFGLADDCLLFLAASGKKYGTSENPKMYKMSLSDYSYDILLNDDLCYGSTIGSDARLYGGSSFCVRNNKAYFSLTVDNRSDIYSCDVNGKLEQLSDNEGSVDCFAVGNDDIYFIGMRNMLLQEVYKLSKKAETRLTSINSYVEETSILPLNKFSFINSRNIRIDGWVIEPLNYEKGKKYPAILDIHGGPKVAFGEVIYHEMQYWANNGYFVLLCNPEGADGRGNEFMHLVNKYGTVDYEDIMSFTDECLKRYEDIDVERVAVTGGSYGGFMTNWIIGHTDRFCCAASQRSISNWVSKSLTTDNGYFHNMTQMASTPWDNVERMWSFSPLKYADKCVTPTLFIQSDEDYRCYMADAIQMYTTLKLHNVDARMCLFHHECHDLSRSGKPTNRRRRLMEMTNWFDKYCK